MYANTTYFLAKRTQATLLIVALSAFLGSVSWAAAPAFNCGAPLLQPIEYECDGAVTISWLSTADAQLYTLDIEDTNGAPIADYINMSDTSVTIVAGTLLPGTDYVFSLTADCGNDMVAAVQGTISGNDIQHQLPELSVFNVVGTSCPLALDGSFEATVQADSCPAFFELILGLDTVAVAAGDTVAFTGLGVDDYELRLRLSDTDTCNYRSSCVDSVSVPVQITSTDAEVPEVFVMDPSGASPSSMLTFSPPEGECGVQLTWSVTTTDNCAPPALSATVSTVSNNAAVFPGGQAELFFNGMSYALEIFAATGTNTVTLTSTDADGNQATEEFIIEVIDTRDPIIQGPGDMVVETPSCDADTPVNWSVVATDDCDLEPNLVQTAGPASGSNLTAGNYTIAYEAADDYGNTSVYSFELTVVQGDSPAPIVDVSGNTQYSLSACEDEAFILFSGNIMDCNITNSTNVAADIEISGAPLEVAYTNVQAGFAYFELSGMLAPGFYGISIGYKGTEVENAVFQVVQDEDIPALIKMPGNLNYTLPQCQDTLLANFKVEVLDDCDTPADPASLTVNLNGNPLQADGNESSPNAFIYQVPLTGELDGASLEVQYVDAGGNISEKEVQLQVNDQADPTPPTLVYPALSIYRNLNACESSEQEICFQVYAADNCTVEPNLVAVVSNAGGTLFPLENTSGDTYCTTLLPGSYTVALQAADDAGNVSDKSFNIFISQEEEEPVYLSCNDQLNVSLNENCSRRITADMVLEGTFGCLTDEDFAISIADDKPQNDSLLDGHGLFVYEIELAPGVAPDPGFEPCWGYINGIDSRDPSLSVPADTDQGTVSGLAYAFGDSLTANDPVITPSMYICMLEMFPQTGLRYYDLETLQVTESGYYTLLIKEGFIGSSGQLALFQGSFSENGPCQNLVALGGFPELPQGNAPVPALSVYLEAEEVYQLMTTTTVQGGTGAFEYLILPAEDGEAGIFETTTTVLDDGTTVSEVNFEPFASEGVAYQLPLQCSDLDFILNNPASLDITGAGTGLDNCGDVEITFEDTYTQSGNCADIFLTRTFTATDAAGNSVSNQQRVTLRRLPTEEVINLPAKVVKVSCDESVESLANGNPAPEATGYPFVQTIGGAVPLDGQHCNMAATFSDGPRANTCMGSYKLTREWTVIDWCDPTQALVFEQSIQVGDFTPPTVSAPAIDYNGDGQVDTPAFSTTPFGCTATFEVPLPVVEDNCSDWQVDTRLLTLEVDSTFDNMGQFVGTDTNTIVLKTVPWNAMNRIVNGVPIGSHILEYRVTDDCGNDIIQTYPLEVRDNVEPVAVCDNDLGVSLGGTDYGRLFAADVDDGSWDNCGLDRLEIRRNKYDAEAGSCGDELSDWSEFVEFSCCDVGEPIMIEVRAIDRFGNINTCMTEIIPEEKTRPTCFAPANITISCGALPEGFEGNNMGQLSQLFGVADATDNCSAAAVELPPIVNLECNAGTILRRFRATDSFGNESINTCQQLITIEGSNNFEIRFPADEEVVCSMGTADSVTYNTLGCDLLAVNFEDEVFAAAGDACQLVYRTWKVINWCQYDGVSDPFVVGRDVDCDTQGGDEAVWVLHRPDGFTYIDRDNDESEDNNIPLASQNLCQGFDDYWQRAAYDGGYYQYLQILSVIDDEAPQLSFTPPSAFCSTDNDDCNGAVNYNFTLTDACLPGGVPNQEPDGLEIEIVLDAFADGFPDGTLSNVLQGSYPNYQITGEYPIGNHRFVVNVGDGCGNEATYLLPFEVVDCVAPAPPCLNGLAVELSPYDADGDGTIDGGIGDVWADDFIIGDPIDCSGALSYSINRLGDPVNIDSTGIYFFCQDTGLVTVEVHTWDPLGNRSTCETFLFVQDNIGVCDGEFTPLAQAAGAIETESGTLVEEVEVSLSGMGNGWMVTGPGGSFSFEGLSPGEDYTITPMRDGDDLNGISTFDMVLISKHILGVAPLQSPYQLIAADVNNSRSISTLDLILLRKLILGDAVELQYTNSWRFIDARYAFPNPADPWEETFPEVLNLNNLPDNGINDADFVAIKVGDVTLDAQANSLGGLETRSFAGDFKLQLQEMELKAGEEYIIPLQTADRGLLDVLGYQGTLKFDRTAVELVDLMPGLLSEEHYSTAFLDEGYLTMSWNQNPQQLIAEGQLLTLVLRARKDARLSDILSIGSRVTVAEAYGLGGELLQPRLAFYGSTQPEQEEQFELHQNKPNPFRGDTQISFELPEAGPVQLIITDVAGKVLKTLELEGVHGYNAITLSHEGLPAGVLQYSLRAGRHFATKRMMILSN